MGDLRGYIKPTYMKTNISVNLIDNYFKQLH